MNTLTVSFLGDIFATPGRMVVKQQLPALREEHQPDLIIANAENIRSGSGITPDLYRKIRDFGIDGVSLGDHVFRQKKIIPLLENPDEPISIPANLPSAAPGKRFLRLPLDENGSRSVFFITVLGQVFMGYPCDSPFSVVDSMLDSIPESNPIVIVEAHMEATSEKCALAYYLDGRVAAVVGTHTHVPTADARILPRGTAFMTDAGMCGAYHSVIGADTESVVKYMSTGLFTPFGQGSGDERMCGVTLKIDPNSGKTTEIKPFIYTSAPEE